jgi:hypothetical protein
MVRVWDLEIWGFGDFGIWGFGVQSIFEGLGFRVQGLGFRV